MTGLFLVPMMFQVAGPSYQGNQGYQGKFNGQKRPSSPDGKEEFQARSFGSILTFSSPYRGQFQGRVQSRMAVAASLRRWPKRFDAGPKDGFDWSRQSQPDPAGA